MTTTTGPKITPLDSKFTMEAVLTLTITAWAAARGEERAAHWRRLRELVNQLTERAYKERKCEHCNRAIIG